MGNFVLGPADNLPASYSYQHTKDLITQLNSLCRQNAKQLRFQLLTKGSQLQYNHMDWKRSIVPGTVTVTKQENKKIFNIVMSLRNVYNCHQTLKHFQKRLSQSKNSTPDYQSGHGATPQGRQGQSPYTKQSQQCCICLDKTPTMMLPCFHTFCAQCTQIHIIQKQQKKCPLCRVEFHEDGKNFKKKIITVVGDQDSLISDLRAIILGNLKQLNSHQVREIQRIIGNSQHKGQAGKMMAE